MTMMLYLAMMSRECYRVQTSLSMMLCAVGEMKKQMAAKN
jgi:hypothetical protein